MTRRGSLAVLALSLLALAGAAAYRRSLAGTPPAAPAGRTSLGDHVRTNMVLAPRDPTMPGPAPHPAGARLGLDNDACETCHQAEAAQWRGSQHQTAYTEREFQRALAHEPAPFCRGCHAPEADPRREASGQAAEIGVGCVSCHVVGDAVLAAPGPDVAAPHPLRRDPRFATAAACANCHQFGFPDDRRRARPEAMQRTLAEHAASPQAATPCNDCHMRDRAGARSHAFIGSRDDLYLREALTVEATRPAPDRIEVRVAARPEVVGHAVPTGDLFRRLAVAVRPEDGAGARPWTTAYLARHYALESSGGPPIRVERSDDRPHPGEPPRVLRFQLDPADRVHPVAWEVRFERVESLFQEREDRAVVVGALTVAAGELPPLP
ncbi:multiheme c-type cytochrome [Nannocystis pusilla]